MIKQNQRSILLMLAFIVAYPTCLPAQKHTIRGFVVADSDSACIPYASLKIIGVDSILTASHVADGNGRFEMKADRKNYLLLVSSTGYFDTKISVENNKESVDLGEIRLKENVKELDEVTVYGSSVVEDVTKTIAYPTSQQLKASTNGIDLLQHMQLPGMFVDPVNQSVSVMGTSGVKYRINGVNASLQQVIALKADQIKRIEYSSLPTIRELESNSAVIHVILKEINTGTYASVNVLSAFTTGFINGNANLKTVYGKSELNLEYNNNWRDYDERRTYAEEAYYKPADTLSFRKVGRNAPFGYISHNINLGYTYNRSGHIFNARFLNSIFNSHDQLYTDIYQSTMPQTPIFRDTRYQSKSYTPSLNLYYIRKIKEAHGFELNLVGTLMNNDYKRDMSEQYPENGYEVHNATDGERQSLIFEGLYYNQVKNHSLTVGMRGSYSHTKNNYLTSDVLSRFRQAELYPYISISGKIQKLSYSLGTGWKVLNTDDYNESRSFYRNLSTVSLFYKKNDYWNLRYTFQYTPGFPSLSSLTDVDQRQDSLVVQRGNSKIKPSQTINNNLTFSYFNKKKIRAGATLFFRKTFNPIGSNIFYESGLSSFIYQTDNQVYQYNYGGEMYLQISSLLRYFTINPLVGWVNYNSKGNDYRYRHDRFYWGIYFIAQYNQFSLNMSYRKPLTSLYGRSISLQENYSNVELNYKKKTFTARTGVRFPFTSGTKYRTELKSSVAPSTSYTYIRDNKDMVYVGLSYYFNSGKSIFRVNKKVNNEDTDSGILKITD